MARYIIEYIEMASHKEGGMCRAQARRYWPCGSFSSAISVGSIRLRHRLSGKSPTFRVKSVWSVMLKILPPGRTASAAISLHSPALDVAMRQTRFMSMLFLVWSIAFFFVPEFRQGLQVPFFALNPAADSGWLRHAGTIPAERLAEAARGAEQQRDAQTPAFAALHAPTVQESVRWADEAVAIDPTLTWVYTSLVLPAAEAKRYPPDAQGACRASGKMGSGQRLSLPLRGHCGPIAQS